MIQTRSTEPQAQATENVRIRVYDIDSLRDAHPEYDSLSKREKLRLARRVEPSAVFEHRNTTCVGLDEYRVNNLYEGSSENENASHLAVGDGTDTPSYGDTSLTNEVYRAEITDSAANGTELFTSTFLDTSEANDESLEEIGLVTSGTGGSDILLNHSLIETINKTDVTTATIDVTLSFSSA